MTATTEDRLDTPVTQRRMPYTLLAVAVAATAVVWPGGQVPLADLFFKLTVLAVIFRAVTRHPGFKELFDAVPLAAKWAAKIVVGAFLIGQLWGVSAQTFPVATWTMYSHDPGAEAVVYRFDAVMADGEPVTFTPNASNRTLPAKMALVHLRGLSSVLFESSSGTDAVQVAEDEATLTRALVAYADLYNTSSPGSAPVSVEVSRVVYDVTQERVTFDSGVRTVLLQIDLETP